MQTSGTIRMGNSCLAALICAAVACVCMRTSASGATANDFKEESAGLKQDVAAVLAVRDRIAATIPEATAGSWNDGCLVLTVAGAVDGKDMRVELLRRGGAWARGKAEIVWIRPVHAADGTGLRVNDNGLSGGLLVTVARFESSEHGSSLGMQTRRFRVSAKVSGRKIEGHVCESDVEDAENLACAGRFIPYGRPRMSTGDAGIGDMTAAAGPLPGECTQERMATTAYEQVRALDFMKRSGLPFEIAAREVVSYRLQRILLSGEGGKDKKSKKGGPSRKKKRKAQAPSLDDMGMDDLALEDAAATPKADYAAMIATVRSMRERVQAMLRLAKAYEAGAAAPAMEPGAAADCGDPEFGPWYKARPLPARGRGGCSLGPAVTDGPQEWGYIGRWRILGPLPRSDMWPDSRPALPDIVPAFDADCSVKRLLQTRRYMVPMKGDKFESLYKGRDPSPVETVDADPANGHVLPPCWRRGDRFCPKETKTSAVGHGMDWATYYACADVYADEAGERWVGVVINDAGALWVNDRLVWCSGEHDRVQMTRSFVFPARFNAGRNRLLLRCDDYRRPSAFSVQICTRGGPRVAEQARAEMDRARAAMAQAGSARDGLRGWRGNWCGQFPDADPVTAWDAERGINVLWRRELPRGQSTPVIAGDRVFTTANPYLLYCFDKMTGKLLWQRECDALELKDKAAYEKSLPLKKRLLEVRRLMPAKRSEAARLKKQGDAAASKQAEAAGVELEKESKQLEKTLGELHREHGAFPFNEGAVTGPAVSTPVTDGKHVWVRFGSFAVACFDLDGKRVWMTETGVLAPGPMMSPVLLEDKFITFVSGLKARAGKDNAYVAWDARSGKELWRRPVPVLRATCSGSPLPLRLSNGASSMDVLVTADGQVIRAADGKLLLEDMALQRWYWDREWDSPIVDGDVIYFTRSYAQVAAVRLIMVDRDRVGAKPLWESYVGQVPYGGYVKAGDRLYQQTKGGWKGTGRLFEVDAKTGRLVDMYTGQFPTRRGDCWSPPAMYGTTRKGLAFADSYRNGITTHLPNSMIFMSLGSRPRVIGRNRIERPIAAPVLEADRVYIRAGSSLTCYGHTGQAGKDYETQVQARIALGRIPREAPDDSEPVEIASTDYRGGTRHRDYRLEPGRLLDCWRIVGPFPAGMRDKARAAVGHPSWKLKTDDRPLTTTVAGTEVMVHDSLLGKFFDQYPDAMWRYRPHLFVRELVGAAPGQTAFCWTAIRNPREQVLRLDLDTPGVRAWLSGVPVRNNQRVRLAQGLHELFLEVEIDDGARDGKVTAVFRPSADPAAELKRWQESIRAERDILEQAVQGLPDSDVARRAKKLLGAL